MSEKTVEINDAWKWVEARTKQKTSPLAKSVCHVLSRMGFGGIYNRPIAFERQDWTEDHCLSVIWKGYLSNWDRYALTALWGWCNVLMLRVEIEGCGPKSIRLRFWQRTSRDGGMGERLPDITNMLDHVGIQALTEQDGHDKCLELESENARLGKERDLLRMAIVRFGDHSKMATVEPMEIQHVIDDAFENTVSY